MNDRQKEFYARKQLADILSKHNAKHYPPGGFSTLRLNEIYWKMIERALRDGVNND